jgi:hypothetical protein
MWVSITDSPDYAVLTTRLITSLAMTEAAYLKARRRHEKLDVRDSEAFRNC